MYVSYLNECYQHIFGNTVIKSWGYLYYDFEGRYLQITSDKLLLDDFLHQELYADQIIDNISLSSGSYYSSDVHNDKFLANSVKDILMKQGYTYFFDIIYKNENYSEVYTFASLEDFNYANNFTLNNLDMFKLISLDLAKRCRRLLTKDNLLVLPKTFIIQMNELNVIQPQNTTPDLKDIILKSKNIDDLFHTASDDVFDFNKLPFSFMASKDLTHKEKEIIYLYYQGFNAHRIAQILDISKRTVDKHFENIKTKLHCEHPGQIISALLRYDTSIKNNINSKT